MSSDPNLPPNVDPNPLPPTSQPGAPLTVDPALATTTGLAPNVAAGLCALLPLIGGLVFIILEKRNQFVRFWAMQSLLFAGASIAFSILSSIIANILAHILGLLAILWGLIALVISLGMFVLWIITIIQAFSGKAWEIPILGKLARQQLAKMPTL